jgi:selenium metabolism protein YedF
MLAGTGVIAAQNARLQFPIHSSIEESAMAETTVDARGQICPKPLIMTKQALKESAVGATLVVLVDNETSGQNVERFLRDNGMAPQVSRDGSVFTIAFTKLAPKLAAPDAEAYCTPAPAGQYIVTLAADVIGRGPAELGATLMKGFLASLRELTPTPTHLVLYSSGILLAVDGSPHIEAIRAIEARGIKVLVCGTCADWYQKKAEIHVGTVSNMLTILETMTAAGRIISP